MARTMSRRTRNVPVAAMDTEPGARTIVANHGHHQDAAALDPFACCAFCHDEILLNPIWFALVIRYARQGDSDFAWYTVQSTEGDER